MIGPGQRGCVRTSEQLESKTSRKSNRGEPSSHSLISRFYPSKNKSPVPFYIKLARSRFWQLQKHPPFVRSVLTTPGTLANNKFPFLPIPSWIPAAAASSSRRARPPPSAATAPSLLRSCPPRQLLSPPKAAAMAPAVPRRREDVREGRVEGADRVG